ncbi:cupin domain-containing protein [Candidatus Latescibacterota bacterium]
MRTWITVYMIVLVSAMVIQSNGAEAEQKGEPFCGQTDPSKMMSIKGVHGGAGSMQFMGLLDGKLFESNLLYIHTGLIPPKSGIGEHIHRTIEEMFFAFNAPAEFTVNGKTALLPSGSCVLCPMGSSHGIYNNSEETLLWINIAVSKEKGRGDAIDYGDDLSNQEIESPAPFRWGNFDKSLLKNVGSAHEGKGEILNRRPWKDGNMETNWVRIGHCVLPPKTSIGYHQHTATEEVYYVMSGTGRATVNDKTWDVGPGDAIPCTLKDSHGIYNNSDEDLDIFVLIVAMEKGVFGVQNWGDDLSDR